MPDIFRPFTNGSGQPRDLKLDVNTTASGKVQLDFHTPTMPGRFTITPGIARQIGNALLQAADKAEGKIITTGQVRP